jgi:putative membrane protein
MKLLRWFALLLRIVLFALLLLFAAKNTELVTLHFYLDQSWQMPLVLLALLFFAIGAGVGVLACLASLFRQRREIITLKRQLAEAAPDRPNGLGSLSSTASPTSSSVSSSRGSANSPGAVQPAVDGVV